MKNLIWLPLIFLIMSFSCEDMENKDQLNLEELEALEREITVLSESVSCINSSEWKFTPMGSKACGGPMKYIAYHQSVEADFLKLVEQFTLQQELYNQQNNVISDCALVVPPRNIICEGAKAYLVN